MHLSVLMPVFNERATVAAAIEDVLETELPVDRLELVVVDDGSTDGTSEILAELGRDERVRVLSHPVNKGKGAALQTAIANAGGDYAAVMDADREYRTADLARLLQPVLDDDATVVFGTRGFEAHSAFSFWYVVGNKGVTFVANLLFNSWLADIMTCHKLMPVEVWRSLDLTTSGFTIEPEITGKLLVRGYRIHEVPVRYRARSRQEGKKLTAADGLRVVATLLRCRVAGSRRRRGRAHG